MSNLELQSLTNLLRRVPIIKVAKNPSQRAPRGFRETNAMHIGGGTWVIRYEPIAEAKGDAKVRVIR
jgi:hypothetical protein